MLEVLSWVVWSLLGIVGWLAIGMVVVIVAVRRGAVPNWFPGGFYLASMVWWPWTLGSIVRHEWYKFKKRGEQ